MNDDYLVRVPIIDRAGGVLLGMAVSDGWSSATGLALCVADAAATGIALTDGASLDLLERNLRELHLHMPAARAPYSHDQLLAVSTVVALAYLYDTPAERADATRSVVGAMDEHAIVDGALLRWVDLVAHVVRTGAVPDEGGPSGAREMEEHVRTTVRVIRHAEFTSGDDIARMQAGLDSTMSAPAATGALLGARFGWRAVPKDLADQSRGWPEANGKALIGLALLAARSGPRRPTSIADPDERWGGTVPIERWDEAQPTHTPPTQSGAPDEDTAGSFTWRRTQVVLTAADADTTTAGA